MAGNAADPRRSVISKVSAIIMTFAEGDSHCLTEIACQSGLPLSTTHRLVAELAAWRILERDADGSYRAGSPLLLMGGRSSCPTSGVREQAASIMEDLCRATGTVVRFGVLDNRRVAYIQKVAAGTPVSDFAAAATAPVHATAMGKVLLAFSAPGLVELVITRGLPQYTPHTVSSPEQLRRTLKLIRSNRIAVAERELHLAESAVAAPVFGRGGHVVAAVEVKADDLSRDVERLRGPLAMAAAGLSRELSRPTCRSDSTQHK